MSAVIDAARRAWQSATLSELSLSPVPPPLSFEQFSKLCAAMEALLMHGEPPPPVATYAPSPESLSGTAATTGSATKASKFSLGGRRSKDSPPVAGSTAVAPTTGGSASAANTRDRSKSAGSDVGGPPLLGGRELPLAVPEMERSQYVHLYREIGGGLPVSKSAVTACTHGPQCVKITSDAPENAYSPPPSHTITSCYTPSPVPSF